MRRLQSLYLLGFLAVIFSIPQTLSAQTSFGSVVGTVTDASGAALPGTEVILTNLGTNEKRTGLTNTDGLYQFVNITPGQYSAEVSKSGFKRTVQSPISVETQSTATANISLQLGNVSQTIEVTAAAPLLQPESSSLGQVIDQRKTDELPLNGRNPLNLVALVPSVVPQGGSMSTPNGQNPFAWGNYQIGGGMANQSMVWLDGSPVNGAYINITALIPTQDSLQEFKVNTNNLSPDYGRFAGGVVSFTTKSGTNELHGVAYEYLRNKLLNANTFFNNQAGVPRPAFTQNQFGFNVGGPVYIPKVYDGRNKTFFFVNYEGYRSRQGQSFTETVPTLQERGGDLSALAASQKVTSIYDPLTTCGSGAPNSPVCAPGVLPGSRQPFAGNIIPTNRINATSLKFLNLYPLPNTSGNAQGVGNWVGNASVGGNQNETVVHLDQNVSDKQHITARYTYWGNLNLPIDPMKDGVCQDRCTEKFNTNNFVLGDTYSFNPTTIMDVRLSYQRFDYTRTPETLGYNLANLGWPSSLNTQAVFQDLPVPVINGFDTANTFGSQGAGSVILNKNDNYRGAGTLTKISGKHTMKFGAEFMRMTLNYAQTNTPTGIFNFGPSFTAQNGLNPGLSPGLGLASFLLGYADGGGASSPSLVAAQQLYPAVFVNDDWHASSKLTINVGVRWEHSGPWTERYNRLSYFSPTQLNQVLRTQGVNVAGNLSLVNSPGDSYRSNIYPDWNQYAPRIGAAYQIASKTVFRGGYGLFWLPNNVAWDYSPNNNSINSYTTPYLASVFAGVPASDISNPFPGGIVPPPGRNPSYATTLLGQSLQAPMLNNPYGYAQQWNADLQHQLGNGFLIDVAYGGAKGTHLPVESPNINQLPDQYLSLGSSLLSSVPNPYYGLITSAGSPLAQPTVQLGQLLRPYPQYTDVRASGNGTGNSTYESLQVKAEKRFSGGNSILVAYTHAKLISDTDTITGWLEAGGTGGYQDFNNLRAEKSLASFDVPNRLVVSYVLDVPIGKGRKFLNHSNALVNGALGGWGVLGVTTIQNGFPLHFSTNTNNTDSFGGGQRPNVVLGCDKSISGSIQSRLNNYFNTSCFTAPLQATFGDESRTDPTLRSPGIANWDFSAFKSFPLQKEGPASIQFRAEFFNIFNRVQFGYPGQTQGQSTFGVITSQVNNPRLVQFALRAAF